MSAGALNKVVESYMGALPDFKSGKKLQEAAAAELAQLRADLQAAQERIGGYESGDLVSALLDANRTQADRIIAQARQLDEARKVIERCSAYIGSIDHGENTKSYMMCDAWLAANPAPEAEQPQCTCGTGDAIMPEYHAAYCILKAEP